MSEGPVLFTYQPEDPTPNSVGLAGEFNSWTPAPLVYSEVSGKFETTLVLEEGKAYRYKYVIDGNWLLAPRAETVWDDGIENSIVRVTPDLFVKSEPVALDTEHEISVAGSNQPAPELEASGAEPTVEQPAPEPEVASTAPESVSVSEQPATEPDAAKIEPEVSAAEPTVAQPAPELEVTGPGAESVSASVVTSEGYVLVQNTTATATEATNDIAPIESKVNGVAETNEEVGVAIEPKTQDAVAPVQEETVSIVANAEETAVEVDPCSDEAPNVADLSADMSSIERVTTGNTAITTPEATTPVKEDAARKHLPDTVPSPVPEESAMLTVPESSSSVPTPTIPAEPSAELPKEPVAAEAITTGTDVAISIPSETPAEPETDATVAGPSPAYQTATKTKQPGILEKIYEFISTSILGKLFQYVFSIFNRSA
ncbi:hypothetical protein V1509DRAFT_637844 [Lipomyces kononenkoae]